MNIKITAVDDTIQYELSGVEFDYDKFRLSGCVESRTTCEKINDPYVIWINDPYVEYIIDAPGGGIRCSLQLISQDDNGNVNLQMMDLYKVEVVLKASNPWEVV